MGYYTRYTLNYVAGEPAYRCGATLSERISEISSYQLTFGTESSEIKWYDHDEHMRLLSREYPKLVFVLRGDGEESGDIWVKYYHDGKCQNAKMSWSFEEFDTDKLK